MLNKNDPLIGAVQEVMKQNQAHRDAINAVNEKFGVQDRRALPHEKQGEWDNEYKKTISEGLHTLKEEAETLDELYGKGDLPAIKKSHDDAADASSKKLAAARGKHSYVKKNPGTLNARVDTAYAGEKFHKAQSKRASTIMKAVDKKKVNEEQLDELSKGKLGSYIKAASHDVATKSAATRGFARDADDKRKSGDFMGSRKSSEKSDRTFQKSWKRREGIAKATDKLTKEDYDSNERDAAKRAGTMHKFQSNYKSDDSKMNALAKKNSKYWKKQEVKHQKKAVTGLDEDSATAASKKAEKGTKWKVKSRNWDRDGSEVELRQGKRVKMQGVYDRNASMFTMSKTKKGKFDPKSKEKDYDDAKDILKTVKEEQITEISAKLASNYLKGNHKSVTDPKGIELRKAYKRRDGKELATDKLSGKAKVPTNNE